MTDAYIGLGSNLDGPEQQLRDALVAINRIPGTTLSGVSSFYRSRPVGPAGQPDYINAVAHVVTTLSAVDLLRQLQAIEDRQGRTREVRWGPRTLDLDLLLYGDKVINEKHLVVPHPELHKRAFVLYPLHEIAPRVEVPGLGPLEQLLRHSSPDDLYRLDQP